MAQKVWRIHHVKHWHTDIEAETREQAIEQYYDDCALDGWGVEDFNETFARPVTVDVVCPDCGEHFPTYGGREAHHCSQALVEGE